jgi:hypothetical protein
MRKEIPGLLLLPVVVPWLLLLPVVVPPAQALRLVPVKVPMLQGAAVPMPLMLLQEQDPPAQVLHPSQDPLPSQKDPNNRSMVCLSSAVDLQQERASTHQRLHLFK